MKYWTNHFDELIIRNDSDKRIFGINRNNGWFKNDYDHNGNRVYYEDDAGRKRNYDYEI